MEIDQQLFNAMFVIAGALGGWIMKIIWDSVKSLRDADRQLTEKVNAIEVLVAGKYVTREEFAEITRQLLKKLDSISDKLDQKADK